MLWASNTGSPYTKVRTHKINLEDKYPVLSNVDDVVFLHCKWKFSESETIPAIRSHHRTE